MRHGLTRPSRCEPPPLELSSYSHPELKLMHRLLESTQNTLFQACFSSMSNHKLLIFFQNLLNKIYYYYYRLLYILFIE